MKEIEDKIKKWVKWRLEPADKNVIDDVCSQVIAIWDNDPLQMVYINNTYPYTVICIHADVYTMSYSEVMSYYRSGGMWQYYNLENVINR